MNQFRLFLATCLFFVGVVELHAFNPPPPSNDTVCNAKDLGTLGIPGPCPTYPYGDTVFVNGSTEFATYNTFDYSPLHCFVSGAPDVWYRFVSTGSNIYLEMNGNNDLDSFYVKIFHSQGSCITLVPMKCESTTTGFLSATFQTPELGGEYFMQIGGSTYDETGAFSFFLKSYNECNGCVKNADFELTPAPWFGRYGTSDTVQMCVTVDRWEMITTSNLHSIVPMFGSDWDTTTLTPISAPLSSSNEWRWFNNVNTPGGILPGFFYDPDFDGDPTNNIGEAGTVLTNWTACWSISTNPSCSSYDLTVDINTYSDDQTGTGNATIVCVDANPIHLGIVGWCCDAPVVTVFPGSSCFGSAYAYVQPVGGNVGDSVNVVLYDTSFNVVGYQTVTGGPAFFGSLFPQDYLVEVYNVSTMCISFATIHVPASFSIDLQQTAIGCGSGSGAAVANLPSAGGPYTFNWLNITTWTDSLAFSLDEGFVVLQVTDAFGCTVTDSIYINTLPSPDVVFEYSDLTRCNDEDTIQIALAPAVSGGIYVLVAPLSVGITVDATTGQIDLNAATLALPYWINVKYTGGSVCTAFWTDSVQIVQRPAAPVSTSPAVQDWCIGTPAPILSFAIGTGIPFWYDFQTTGSAIGYTYAPPLTSSSAVMQYFYGASYLTDFVGGCASLPIVYSIQAIDPPVVLMSFDTTICEGDAANLFAIGSPLWQYSWSPIPTSGVANLPATITSPLTSTMYSCVVSDGACSTTGSVNITVQSAADCRFGIYSGFTPNNDGFNDTWIIEGADSTAGMTVSIYSRWGNLVWQKQNYDNVNVVWNGQDRYGVDLPEGTYYYTIFQLGIDPIGNWIELSR